MSKDNCAYLVCPPEDLLERYPPERAEYQRAAEETNRMLDFILNCDGIKAVFAGHLHENYEGMIFGKKMQYVTGGTFNGDVREIIIE